MIKNDYLTAKIQELSEVITKVEKLNNDAKFEDSHLVINEALKKLVGLSPDLAESLSYKDIIKFIGAYESADSVKFMILGNLLKLLGDVYKGENNFSRSFNIYLKGLNIYGKAISLDEETCMEQCSGNIEKIIEEIDDYEIPSDSQYCILRYYEAVGKYDKSEDILYDLIEMPESEINILQEGIHFYERLLHKSEADLEKGNLPLDEVEYGLKRIKKLLPES